MPAARHSTLSFSVLLLLAASGAASAAPPVKFTTIAYTTQPAPGIPDVTFAQVADPRLNDAGEPAFWTRLAGTGITTSNDTALWVARAPVAQLVAREGDTAPETGGTYFGLPTVMNSRDGRIAFAASILEGDPKKPVNVATYTETTPGLLDLREREAINTATIPGAFQFNGINQVAYQLASRLAFGGAYYTIGDPAPGFSGSAFRSFGQPSIAEHGEVAFHAQVGASATNYATWTQAIYAARSGGLAPIVKLGDAAPGADAGAVFTDLGRTPIAGPSGEILFWAAAGAKHGLWRSDASGVLTPVVISGSAAPNLSGVTLKTIGREPSISSLGTVACSAVLEGAGVDSGNNTVILVQRTGQPLKIALREGDIAPGKPVNVLVSSLGAPALSSADQLAFTVTLKGAGVTAATSVGLVASAPGGSLVTILQTGDALSIDGVGNRTVRHIAFAPGAPDSGATSMSGPAKLAFKVTFTDWSEGLFTADIGCRADFDGSGFVDINDQQAFIAAFEAGEISADFDGSGFVDLDDHAAFIAAFEAGC